MAAIFDMDGLLLNTDPDIWVESMFDVSQYHQVNVTKELLKYTKGLRIYEVTAFWNEYFNWNNPSKANQIAEDIIDTVIAKTYQKGKIMPGVLPLLEAFQKEKIPIGLATSSTRRMVDDLISFFNLNSFFQVISTADACVMGKPHPEVYLNCAAQLNVLPWKSVAFEDSVNGMVAAKAARMLAVVVPSEEQFESPRFGLAEMKIRSLEQFSIEDYQDLLAL